MITVEAFAAGFGDALLITYGPDDAPTRLLIDGGLRGTAVRIRRRLEELDARIDLLVVTHIDADHIAGVVKLLDDPWFVSRVDAVWFNGYVHLDQFSHLLGVADGERLAERLERLGVAWNAGWPWRRPPGERWNDIGGPIVVDDEPVGVELPGDARAVVLSPNPDKMQRLLKVWRAAIRDAGLVDGVDAAREQPAAPSRVLLGRAKLPDLARRRSAVDRSEANGSSIAFVLDIADGGVTRRLLLAGDAHPDLLVAGIDHLRDGDERLQVDLCKLPHHASSHNVTTGLVERLDCRHWLISTNGRRFHHPNKEALARVILSNPGSTLYGNYRSNQPLASFTKSYSTRQHGYDVVRPPAGNPGIIVTLGS